MLKRIKRGLEFTEAELALDVIAQVGPGGSYMVNPHTMKRMKNVALLPSLADRNARAHWESKGSLDTYARAQQRAREILARQSAAAFPPEVEARIQARFAGLAPVGLQLPEGW
jgi:trimethylamine--corrinoid protein Co-methyltransferase